MDPLYVIGGEQKADLKDHSEWHRHRAGVVLRIDPDRRTAETVLEYQTPPELCPDNDPSCLFKAATLRDGRLYACTTTEVLIYDFPSMTLRQHISHPCFNDVHHVAVADDGRVYVASTGLDMVVEMSPAGDIQRQWCVLEDRDPWHRFSPDVDYRRVATTKPHAAHPNYVFFRDGQVWATRCRQRDAVCLTQPGLRFQVGAECPIHDGVVTGHGIYFTRVDAHLVHVDRDSLQVSAVHDLSRMMPGLRKPGWCRGLHVLDERHALVGFTRMRPTKWQSNVNWLKLNELTCLYRMPARVALFDLVAGRVLWDLPLQEFGLTTVFSIHPSPHEAAARNAA